jgi:hypothetical protein
MCVFETELATATGVHCLEQRLGSERPAMARRWVCCSIVHGAQSSRPCVSGRVSTSGAPARAVLGRTFWRRRVWRGSNRGRRRVGKEEQGKAGIETASEKTGA